MELLELPSEMLLNIAMFLDAKSLCLVGGTCKLLHGISNTDTLWRDMCQRDYNVSTNKGWNRTFKQLYTEVLFFYDILGFHRLALSPFGGLVHVTWSEGEIKVDRIYPGRSAASECVSEPAFTLNWKREFRCVHSPDGPALAHIKRHGGRYYVLRCSDNECYRSHRRISSLLLGQSDRDAPKGFKDHPDVYRNCCFFDGYNYPLLPVEFGSIPSHFPLTPGFYQGDYGGHGVEIIQVKVNDSNPYLMECLKITGDPNVHAGNVTVKVYLDKPVILREEDQFTIESIEDADSKRRDEEYKELLEGNRDWRQPFCLPQNCLQRVSNPPNTCQARYLGSGLLSNHNFQSPSYFPVHVMKFDNDTFGVLWCYLFCFMMMHREKQFV